jgi:hypothetical protein
MTTDRHRTGKPRCRVNDSLVKPCEELVAQARVVVYFADEEYDPLSRRAVALHLEGMKILPVAYGPRSERLNVIHAIIDRLIIEGVIKEAPSGSLYLWRDPRLQGEYEEELEREFGKPLGNVA